MKKACIILFLVIFISAGIAYFILPASIPTHIGVSGVDAYGNKATIFFFPFLSLVVTAAILLTRKIDPKKKNYKKFEKPFYAVIFAINLVLLGIMGLMIVESFWPNEMNISFFLCILFGVMFMIIGNLLPKLKANYMIGIRTPWTISSEEVWYRTHRICGKVWFIGGLLLILASPLTMVSKRFTEEIFFLALTAYFLVIAAIPCIYSYICFQQLEKKTERKSNHDRN